MTITDIKSALLNNARQYGLCDVYHNVLIAVSTTDLISAAISATIWAYNRGVVTDSLLTEFDETDLNAAGVYTTGTITLTNPAGDIYLLKEASADITVNGTNKLNLIMMGSSSATILVAATGYVILNGYDTAQAGITANDSGLLKAMLKKFCQATITANDTTVMDIDIKDLVSIDYTGNDTSYSFIKTSVNAIANIISLDPGAQLKTVAYDNSVINSPLS